MNITTLDNITTSQLGEVLCSLLADERWDRLEVAVAFVKASGIIRIEPDLERFVRRGGTAEFICGVDEGVTSFQGLSIILDCGAVLRIYRHPAWQHSFHPKIYLFTSSRNSEFSGVVGSANLTAGGLYTNAELSLMVEGDEDDRLLLQCLQNTLDTFRQAAAQIMSQAELQSLMRNGLLEDEGTIRGPSRGAAGQAPTRVQPLGQPIQVPRLPPVPGAAIQRTARRGSRVQAQAGRRVAGLPTTGARTLIMMLNPVRRPHTPGEVRVPVEALHAAPEIWQWPEIFQQHQPGAHTYSEARLRCRFTSQGDADLDDDVRLYYYPRRGEFRLTSAHFRARADEHDILVVEPAEGMPAIDLVFRIVRRRESDYPQLRAQCNRRMPNSPRYWALL